MLAVAAVIAVILSAWALREHDSAQDYALLVEKSAATATVAQGQAQHEAATAVAALGEAEYQSQQAATQAALAETQQQKKLWHARKRKGPAAWRPRVSW